MSEIIQQHINCPDCGSRDALCVYSDGHTYCFSCKTHRNSSENWETEPVANRSKPKAPPLLPQEVLFLEPLKARGLTKETCTKYGYYKSDIAGEPVQAACYCNEAGQVVGQKIRWKNKDFRIYGKVGDAFYGQHLWPGGGKKLIITEGEIDCLTVSQVQQNKYPVVSVPCGAGSAAKVFKAQLQWLEQFDEVVTMFDMDEAGESARKDVSGLLRPGKLKHATLPLKDPNECLVAGKADEIIRAIWSAKPWRPDNIRNGAEMWDMLNEAPLAPGIPLPWDIKLNQMTQGVRRGELVLFTAGSGVGKTTMVRAIAYHLGTRAGQKIGMAMLEESNTRTAKELMSQAIGRRLHIEWDSVPKEDIKRAFEETLGTGNFVLYDHFGSIEGDNLINQLRYMAVAEGCQFLVLDHISIAISGLAGPDERKIIDMLMTKLAALTQELNVGILVISHLTKTDGKGKTFETGRQITLNDLRGSGALAQLSFTVVALERDTQEEDQMQKNIVTVRLLKCRHTGETGLAGQLWFNKDTDRLEDVPSGFNAEGDSGEIETEY